jgi:hypothetical protein
MKWHFTPLIKENKFYKPLARRGHCELYLLFTDKRPSEPRKELKESKSFAENK